jgi:Cyclin, N-terminal domain
MEEYSPDITRLLISKSNSTTIVYPNKNQGLDRDRLIAHLMTICEAKGYLIQTFQLASHIFAYFVQKCNPTGHILEIGSIASLVLAVNFNEIHRLSEEEAVKLAIWPYRPEVIKEFTFMILKAIDWRLNIPTSVDIIDCLLLSTGLKSNLAHAFSMHFYLDFELSQFSQLETAIVSIICALEQLNQLEFRNKFINTLNQHLTLDLRRLDNCKQGLIQKLSSTELPYNLGRIQAITRDKISSLIHRAK